MICTLVPKMEADKKLTCKSLHWVLNALEAPMSLMMHKGQVGAVGTSDKAAMGYYPIKWLSELTTLQEDTEGMSGMISTASMVVDGCTSTGYSTRHTGTHHLVTEQSWR
jgi:hypothetical protein